MRLVVISFLLIVLALCVVSFTTGLSHLGTPPDPNDPKQAGMLTPEVLRHYISGASDNLLVRLRKHEITDAQFNDEMAKATRKLLDEVRIERIPPAKAWEYGEIFITARRWTDAKNALLIAVKAAKNEDRRVNDNVRLARVEAELGDITGAIKTTRSTFNAPDNACAPILPATLLEIVPAARGKGHDLELAPLLEDAIKCEARTIVNASTEPGRDFLFARPVHIRNAWELVVKLYEAGGKPDEAKAAQDRSLKMLSEQEKA